MTTPETFTRLQSPLHDRIARQAPARLERFRAAAVRFPLCAVFGGFSGDAEATRFAKDESNPQEERAAVVRAFFYCHQHDPDEMWSNSILAVFSGLLEAVRCKIREAGVDDAEVGQVLVLNLLSVARAMDVTNPKLLVFWRTAQQLREDTFAEITKERNNYRRRLRRLHDRGSKGDRIGADDDERYTAVPGYILDRQRQLHQVDRVLDDEEVRASLDVDASHRERDEERHRQVLAFLREKLTEDDYQLLTCISEDRSIKEATADRIQDTEDKDAANRVYLAVVRRKSRLHEKARRLLRENGLWEALGPSLAMPTLGIC
jgi:hypothetical protein